MQGFPTELCFLLKRKNLIKTWRVKKDFINLKWKWIKVWRKWKRKMIIFKFNIHDDADKS